MNRENMRTEQLELSQVYNGIYGKNLDGSQNQRVITIPASALGGLRKDLIETMGEERTKGFLLRYGWNMGVSDALNMLDIYGKREETFMVGPKIHTMHGYQDGCKIRILALDFKEGILNLEGTWVNSYEALQQLELFGVSDQPICHTLTGLASGYLSTILGEKVIAKEVECQGMGHKNCRVICRTLKEWKEEIQPEIKYYEMTSLIHELDQTYEQLKHERDNLNMAYEVHEKLMKEVLRDNRMSSHVELLYEITKLPAFIEDVHHQILEAAGITKEEVYANGITELEDINKTEYFQISQDLGVLKTPLYLNQKIAGYYSLIYYQTKPQELDKMIIERASLTSSLSMLKERIRFQSEQRVRGRFLEDILSGVMNKEETIKRAYYLGVKLSSPYFVIALKATHRSSLMEELEFNDGVINYLDQYFKGQQISALMGLKSERIIILCSGNTLLKNQKNQQQLCEKLYHHLLKKYPQNQFKFGISSLSDELDHINELYEESLVSVKIASKSRRVVPYGALGIEGILFQLNNENKVQKLIQKKMGKLLEEDKHKNGELTKTLYEYLNTGCNVLKTARIMNFSVSGLRYRLDRISEILEMDIKKPSNTYQIFMALQFLILSGEVDIELNLDIDGEELDIDG